jgi:hypothetical protein
MARLIAGASEVAGTAFGAIVGVSTGDPVLIVSAAVAGSVFGKSVGEVASRTLSARQEHRAGALVIQTLAAVKAKEVLGETYRDDGFFEGERSDGDEFVEGVLRAAMNAYEERKVRYLANILANVCFNSEIDTASANYALHMAGQLAWTELEVLGIFWAAQEKAKCRLPDHEKNGQIGSWREATVHQTYLDLNDRYKLIHHIRQDAAPGRFPLYNMNLSAVRLSNGGALIAGLADLEDIPWPDIEPLYSILVQPVSEVLVDEAKA